MKVEGPIEPDVARIAEGKRLIRAGGDRGLSLAERISNRLHRLMWHTPFHGARLRGNHPPRLLANPDDPIAGDPHVGSALLDGTVLWRGERVSVAELDFTKLAASPTLVEYLHGFGWLRDLAAVGARAEAVPVAEAIARKWLASHGTTVSDPAWRYDIGARRILFSAAHASLILATTDPVYRSGVLDSLARTARHLERGAARAPQGGARIAAWCGVVAAGLLFPGGQARQGIGEAGLARAIASGFSEDGGLVCRSPEALLDTIALLAMLRAVYAARGDAPFAPIETALMRAVPALLCVVHGDGGLGSWQGGGPIAIDRVAATLAAVGIDARPLRQARDWGYQRLEAGDSVVMIDAAPPPISRHAAGGCASTLAIEFSDGPNRLIVNCGGGHMGGAWLSYELAEGLRTTAAHSTLVLADNNSTAIHADGGLGRGVGEIAIEHQESDGASRLEASHDGYVQRFGLLHRRTLLLNADGSELRGEDALLPVQRKSRDGGSTAFAVRFHLAPDVESTLAADGQGALLSVADGPAWQFRCRGGSLTSEESLWIDGNARPRATRQLVITGEADDGGATTAWLFKRAD